MKKKLPQSELSYDLKDAAHIVAGIAIAKPSFFVSYNLRHFRIDKIKTDFKAISLTPAQLLQYLRLRGKIA